MLHNGDHRFNNINYLVGRMARELELDVETAARHSTITHTVHVGSEAARIHKLRTNTNANEEPQWDRGRCAD